MSIISVYLEFNTISAIFRSPRPIRETPEWSSCNTKGNVPSTEPQNTTFLLIKKQAYLNRLWDSTGKGSRQSERDIVGVTELEDTAARNVL